MNRSRVEYVAAICSTLSRSPARAQQAMTMANAEKPDYRAPNA
jgi:hypothetical protein